MHLPRGRVFTYWTTCENIIQFFRIKWSLYLRVNVRPHKIIAHFALGILSRLKRGSSHIMLNIRKWFPEDIVVALWSQWRHMGVKAYPSKIWVLCISGSLWRGNHRWPVDSLHKGPVMRKTSLWRHHFVSESSSSRPYLITAGWTEDDIRQWHWGLRFANPTTYFDYSLLIIL